MKAAAVGFTCVDVYEDGRYYATGNGVNVLFHLKKRQPGLSASVVTAVGDDEYGRLMLETCRGRGVDVSHVRIVPDGSTAFVRMRMNGTDRIHYRTERGVISDYRLSGEDMDFLRSRDIIHTDLSWQVVDPIREMRKNGSRIYFDFSVRWQHPDVEEICRNIDYGIFSFPERTKEAEDVLKRGVSLGARILIATFGEKGAAAWDGEQMYFQPAVLCPRVVNTCGAGDSFGAGFLYGLMEGRDIASCLRLGAEEASRTVGIFEPYW